MYDIVILDWRNFCKIASYSILSGAIACTFPTEEGEIKHRMMKRALCLRMDNPKSTIVIAEDTKPYWRTGYLEKWYKDRDLDNIPYKGNRNNSVWSFQMTKEEMENLFAEVKEDMKKLLEFVSIGDTGLEADDIWGVLTAADDSAPFLSIKEDTRILGISTDHDWAQCCRKGRIYIENPLTGKVVDEQLDMRPYYLGGDSGDNVKGCPKMTKAGKPAKKGWGITGALKHVEANPHTWWDGIDEDHLAKNAHVMKLPCPAWDVQYVLGHMGDLYSTATCEGDPETLFRSYGLPPAARKKLSESAERKTFIDNLRGKLQAKLHSNGS